MSRHVFTGARIFDGEAFHDGRALVVEDGCVVALTPAGDLPDAPRTDLGDGILAPGFVDLQVNGGGGVMLGDAPVADSIDRICETHGRLGTTTVLPTLISDTPDVTRAVVAAGIDAARRGVAGFGGLHLEGPHLDPRKAGAHDPALLRPMTDEDLDRLVDARAELPALLVTLAPVAARPDEIRRLTRAGVTVSLGHADATAADARRAFDAGAKMATHLFNAMSQLGSREPGLVGAVLEATDVSAGVIADGVHVAPEVLRIAIDAKRGDRFFLVTDAMAVAGTDLAGFDLGGRAIQRRDGRLTLADGTLAGADCDMATCLRVAVGQVGLSVPDALAMATSIPADAVGLGQSAGRLAPGRRADFTHLSDDLHLRDVWRGGERLSDM
jgi:N-acetylglucosamine-6-phosphate deacetylase